MKKILMILSGLILISCEQEISDDEKLARLYVDMVMAREKYIHSDSLYTIEKEKVLEQHKTTEEEYFSSLRELKYEDERWKEFFMKAKTYVDTLEKHNKKRK